MIRSWLDKNARPLAIALMMALVVLYFIYMTVQGDRGIFSMLRMQNELRTAEEDLARTKTEREALEARVKHMRPDTIDPDLLDEQTRLQLNMVKPEDVVVFTAPQQEKEENPAMLQRNKQ